MDAPAAAEPQNGAVHRSLPTRLRHAWRAVERTPWPDVALAAALSLVTVWLTLRGAEFSGNQDRFSPYLPEPSEPVEPPEPPEPLPPERLERLEPPEPMEPMEPADPSDRRESTDPSSGNVSPGDVGLVLLTTVPLIGRRRWPLFCLAAQIAGLLGYEDRINLATVVAILIGAYSLAVYGRSALLSMCALLVAAVATAVVKTDSWPELPGWAGVFAILLSVGLFGVAIRAARSRARAADQRAEALEREQQAATRLAVEQERARIARELHDVVSHHVSVMTIQAGAAGKVIDAEPALARGALSAIEASGRETMAELRHLLGVLSPEQTDDPLHPQPGLDQLDALVDKVRQVGQPVSVRRAPVTLSRGMDLTAYRVVQEALTNALRHAPGARTDIAIATEPSADPAGGPSTALSSEPPALPSTANGRTDLVIEVTNDAVPPGTPPGAGDGSGTGLLGLAERLHLYGGTLETGRRVGGGFRLRARMPLDAPSQPEPPLEAA
jgi:signal transduction histidine kinase